MTEQSPYERLGVSENATFEEIQAAKQLAIAKHRDDVKLMDGVEAAYDAILMDRLKMRQQGKIKVPEDVRMGEKKSSNYPRVSVNLPQASGLSIDTFALPTKSEVITNTSVYALLGVAAAIPAIAYQLLPLLMAIGIGFCTYIINGKIRNFWIACLWSFGMAILGIAIGGVVANFAAVYIAQIGWHSSIPSALIGFVMLWLVSTFKK
jgi:hypothetical protein